jgi:hypothetical protein
MNHKVRAKGLVGRGMPPRILVKDGTRMRWIDVTSWQQSIEKAVVRGLRQAERESYRHGVSEALNVVGNQLIDTGEQFPDAKAALRGAINRMLDLHKRGPQ